MRGIPGGKAKWGLIAAAGLLIAAVLIWGPGYAEVRAGVARTVDYFRTAGAWPFFAAMAVLPAAGFPISAFNAVAGPVFGPTMGVGNVIACAGVAIAVNMAASYWIADRALRPLLERWVKRKGHALPELPSGAAWEITLVVRLIPGLPLFLQNYLLGLARVPFATYLGVSLAVQMTYLVAVVLAGDALARGDWRALAASAVLLVFVGFVMHRLRLRFVASRKLKAAGPTPIP